MGARASVFWENLNKGGGSHYTYIGRHTAANNSHVIPSSDLAQTFDGFWGIEKRRVVFCLARGSYTAADGLLPAVRNPYQWCTINPAVRILTDAGGWLAVINVTLPLPGIGRQGYPEESPFTPTFEYTQNT